MGSFLTCLADPDEVNNLWDDAGLADVRRQLLDAMLNWRIESGMATRNLFQDHR